MPCPHKLQLFVRFAVQMSDGRWAETKCPIHLYRGIGKVLGAYICYVPGTVDEEYKLCSVCRNHEKLCEFKLDGALEP